MIMWIFGLLFGVFLIFDGLFGWGIVATVRPPPKRRYEYPESSLE